LLGGAVDFCNKRITCVTPAVWAGEESACLPAGFAESGFYDFMICLILILPQPPASRSQNYSNNNQNRNHNIFFINFV